MMSFLSLFGLSVSKPRPDRSIQGERMMCGKEF
ncbi:hypothetical protein L288_05015 [Sphingobium quisquiliarum P25]|uniref:Uncharacterized protein n=1 Tax=Sphingobium quisquiliarum P25 TaxID=1329909 RepID=T0H0Z1_9SPHN|nr:hypothetical protein L288_05015 [Sphingobium quisquiliarum P25]EZP72689.1 hypothetical protein BV96_01320 [Sphingomonas paucimobilis]